ncbi:metal transporter CNNM4-like protein [Willisornis vidua]|uniref:Metal transporter n=1 Tax=Willisornis vidua TaxID=1566151 RepID=A0ABQ9DCZ2_9PASS|nr:metal transporter CNNM4-like protein [Willisornis vidua]
MNVLRSQHRPSQPWLPHQGPDGRLVLLQRKKHLLPLWLQVALIAAWLVLSHIFSGLSLGLTVLHPNGGPSREQRFARMMGPILRNGSYRLCSLLLGNVLLNSTLTIPLHNLIDSGFGAVTEPTIGIIILVSQALCSWNGLAMSTKTILITKCVLLSTFPLSYSIGKLLHWLLVPSPGLHYSDSLLGPLWVFFSLSQDVLVWEMAQFVFHLFTFSAETEYKVGFARVHHCKPLDDSCGGVLFSFVLTRCTCSVDSQVEHSGGDNFELFGQPR